MNIGCYSVLTRLTVSSYHYAILLFSSITDINIVISVITHQYCGQVVTFVKV